MNSRILLTTLLTAFTLTLFGANQNGSKECSCTPNMISKAFTNVAKQAIPAVVFIKASGSEEGGLGVEDYRQQQEDFFSDDFFNRFFGVPKKKQPKQQLSQGSGFIVKEDGYIVTNAHVVKGANKIAVILHDGREMDATLVGIDKSTDLAVIKIEGKKFPYVNLGSSEDMEIGEWVVAIGSPFQLEASVTVGVISAKGRQNLRITDLEDFLQTDAAINPGNSGGPLLNLKSEVIGINTAIVSRSGGYMGIGFAIPSDMAKHVMNEIIDNGTVSRGFMGVSLQPVDNDIADAFGLERPEGALVAEVMKGSPADKAGLKQGDIILEYNGTRVKSVGSLRKDVSLNKPGTAIKLRVNRNGKLLMIKVTLGSHFDNTSMGGVIHKLGMDVEPLNPDLAKKLGFSANEEGIVITKIKPGSAAALAGLRPGFLILAINHEKVKDMEEFNESLKKSEKSSRVLILAKHGNSTRFYSLKIE